MLKKSVSKKLFLAVTAGVLSSVFTSGAFAAEEKLENYALDEMLVTASRMQVAKVDTPANTYVVDAEKIESRKYQSVAEALADVPGATVIDGGFGVNEKIVTLNGDTRVLVLVDGRRVSQDMGTVTGNASLDFNVLSDVNMIERIEIVKGHGGALYGSDAVGGVVNVITKKIDGVSGKVGYAAGSSQYRQGKMYVAAKEGKTGVVVSASKEKQGYYKYKDAQSGETKRWDNNTKYDNEKVALKLTQELSDKTNLTIGYDYAKIDGYTPGMVTSPYPNPYNKKSQNFYAKYDWLVNDADEGYVQIYHNRYDYVNDGGMKLKTTGFDAQQVFTTSDVNKLVVGVSHRSADASNENAYPGGGKIKNTSIFVNDMWEFIPTWSLNAGVRYDHHDKAGSKTTMSAGLNKKFDEDSHAYFNWGQVFKAPTTDDLFYNYWGYTGNPNLKPEKGTTWTVGYGTKLHDKLEANISYFQTNLNNAIDWAQVGQGAYLAMNVDKQKTNGFELSLVNNIDDNWDLEASYTYARVRNNTGTGFVRDRNVIPNMYRVGVRYHDEKWNADLFLRAGSGANTSVYKTQYGPDKTAFLDSSYITIDLSAKYAVNKSWNIWAKGYNLLNKSYTENAGSDTHVYDYPAQGRHFMIGAEYSF